MNIKEDLQQNKLVSILRIKTNWNLARVKFLAAFISSLCKLQTVSYVKLSEALSGSAQMDSNMRRIQRFFADFVIDQGLIARIVFSMLPLEAPYRLSLDRTNWKFGKTNINILMISVCYKGVGIPLIWMMLDKRGNSNTKERKDLLERYIKLFGTKTIESIGADREFIGDKWIEGLIKEGIHFFIRIKGNMWVDVPREGLKKAFWLFNKLPLNKAKHYRQIMKISNNYLYLSGLRKIGKGNKIEFVIVATYSYNPEALTIYKDRWQIETMFKALKTSGFNFEVTHLTDLERISKLLAVMCIAFIWAYNTGIYLDKIVKPIKIKKHGRRAYSFFKYGLRFISNALLCNKTEDIKLAIQILSCT